MKYYGANVFDFTPNLSYTNADASLYSSSGLRVARVYAHQVYCYYKDSPPVDKTGWSDPNMDVPVWYTSLDPDYGSPTPNDSALIGINPDNNCTYQTQFVFDTSFLGSQAAVRKALMTIYGRSLIPYLYNLCGTPVYCNFYASEAFYIHTYLRGQPINVSNSGSGYAARFGPYPAVPSGEVRRQFYFDCNLSADTVPLNTEVINKTGFTKLTGLTSSCLTLANPGLFFYECMTASVTVYYYANV